MPRPPAASNDSFVDAAVCARAGSTIERHFPLSQLPRLNESGARAETRVEASFGFSELEGRPAIEGRLDGTVVLTCQRCMQALPLTLDDEFQVVIVPEERADEPAGYEPVIGDPSRFDLRWLAEEQALLALPLVPMHEPGACGQADAQVVAGPEPERPEESPEVAQKPFENLRELLRRR